MGFGHFQRPQSVCSSGALRTLPAQLPCQRARQQRLLRLDRAERARRHRRNQCAVARYHHSSPVPQVQTCSPSHLAMRVATEEGRGEIHPSCTWFRFQRRSTGSRTRRHRSSASIDPSKPLCCVTATCIDSSLECTGRPGCTIGSQKPHHTDRRCESTSCKDWLGPAGPAACGPIGRGSRRVAQASLAQPSCKGARARLYHRHTCGR